jgi:tRNA dimethylallyltransferase
VGAEIISVDSMQVYRGMDIGTAKPGPVERAAVPHHLVDVVDPEEAFTVAEFQEMGRSALDRLAEERTAVLICGGSGLHFRALVDPLRFRPTDPRIRSEIEALDPDAAIGLLLEVDPVAGHHVDLANPRRVTRALEIHRITGETPRERAASPEAEAVRAYRPIRPVIAVGIDPGAGLKARVNRRLEKMMEAGFLGEVRSLETRLGPTARLAVGYRQLIEVAEGTRSLDEGVRRTRDATTALARRQRTFFRRDPRIVWAEWHDDPAAREHRVLHVLEEAGWTS